ncbi:MAG TPA: glycosyltransferase family 39 protein [Candidatus Omnitrophota bacterium]|nr:glycosyltransferase family 39 protein [Candidatus Omnitrophota bacterium]
MNTSKKLLLILAAALIVRVAVFFYYQSHAGIQTFEYEAVATNLIEGKGFLLEINHTFQRAPIAPVFPVLCAFLYLIFGHHPWLIIALQIMFNIATCAVIFFLGKKLFDQKTAFLAAILTALHPGLIIYSSTKLHALSLYTFLICFSLYLIVIAQRNTRLRYKLLLGFITGICVLERATFLPFFILSWIWLYRNSLVKKETRKTILASLIALIVIISPWVIRNTLIFKRCVFIQTNQWWGLWAGNNPQSSGTLYMPSGITAIDASPKEFREKLFSLDELGQMDLFKTTALTFIREHPDQFTILTIKKFLYFWWFSPQAGILYPVSFLVWYTVYYSFILGLALIGLILAFIRKESRSVTILMLLLFLSNSFVHSFYYLEGRHRWSIEPLLLIYSAYAIIRLMQAHQTVRVKQNE